MSAFSQGEREFGKSKKISALDVGDKRQRNYPTQTTRENSSACTK
jgi:hypothetical protein